MRARLGGNWTNGVNAGISIWNLNNSSSNVNSNNGGRTLINSNFIALCFPHRLVKIRCKEQGLVNR